ncbi:COPII coat assembly protein sec16-like [Trichoplusia ni]|uniref:COPII coat assembly protein sec16-like n=1 Tax=Trichoplusia ni TaxID=7111 RepID=A0A7E5VET7_TRINI|nr:COPII coat assembly protein sec16-like [Trichoplusia ni]
MGIRRVEHARSLFAAETRAVRREWPRRHDAPRPPRPRAPLAARPFRKARAGPRAADVILLRPSSAPHRRLPRSKREVESEAGDVIDLGAPRQLRHTPRAPLAPARLRARPQYKPNPRLYPGCQSKSKSRPKRAEPRGGDGRGRRRKRVFRRPVPNARLYRPAPARPPPPPAWPRATWPPPAPPARLDTASRAALRLSEQRRGPRTTPRPPRPPAPPAPPAAPPAPAPAPPASPPSRRLVVTVPAPGAAPPQHYRPASEHFRLRSLDTDSGASTPAARRPAGRAPPPPAPPLAPPLAPPHAMDAGNRHSTSPEDCSDGNETLSAPSEFLAEFLSAIMRRQYAEALKYCRLILQYEPHNATARGFYPLLQHKVQAHKQAEREGDWPRGSSSEEASAHSDKPPHSYEMMEQGADESEGSARACSRSSSRSAGSCASQSSLELDSSDALVHSSPSLSLSRRTDHTDSTLPNRLSDAVRHIFVVPSADDYPRCAGASGGCWESSGSASRSEPDDNGNAGAAPPAPLAPPARADLENDNAAAAGDTLRSAHKSDSASSLRRLRAQFTCSIK